MDNDYQEEVKAPDYPACLTCPTNHDTADGICNTEGPCQVYTAEYQAEGITAEPLTPEPAPVEVITPEPAPEPCLMFDDLLPQITAE